MASTAVRKSSRPRAGGNANTRPPVRSPEGPNEPFGDSDTPSHRYLRQLYQEIHDTSVYGVDDAKRRRIQDMLRRARSQRFWESVPAAHKAVYQLDSEGEDEDEDDETDVVVPQHFSKREAVELTKQDKLANAIATFSRDIRRTTSINDDMLAALVESCGYPLLSICLHSDSFLQYIETSQDEYEDSKAEDGRGLPVRPLSVGVRVRAIESAQASLELFAKVRHLEFLNPIRVYDEDFQLVLSNIFKPYSANPNRRDLGIRENDMRQIHEIDPGNSFGKSWTLPVDPDSPAELCSLTYTVTEDLKRDYPELNLDDELTEPQEEIADSVFLKGYEWPKMDEWPTDDPREDGYETACICCGRVRGAVPKPRNAGLQPETCACTLQDMQLKHGMPQDEHGAPREILFEIAADGGLGNGVRALQNIHEGDYLGVYVGEIYPRSKLSERQVSEGKVDDPDEFVGNRYGGNEGGGSYIMDLYMVTHRHQKPGQPQRNKGKKQGQKKTKKQRQNPDGDDDDDANKPDTWMPLDRTEYRRYVVDSALRGNWTRFLNHNCDANVKFETAQLGCKSVVTLVAVRNITFGEWMTVDYGVDYFPKMNFACRCGMSNCLFWNTNNKTTEIRTLGEAMKGGRGPAWARNTEGVPREATKYGDELARKIIRSRQRRSKRKAAGGDGNNKRGESEVNSLGDLTTTTRATKTSKTAAANAQNAANLPGGAPPAGVRRSERQRELRRNEPAVTPPTAAKRPATSAAGGASKRQKKR